MNAALSKDPNDHLTCDPASCEVAAEARSLGGRHPSTVAIMRYFDHGHLPPRLQEVSGKVRELAYEMLAALPDDPESTAGLRKLLEAKDCFVRAALPRDPGA